MKKVSIVTPSFNQGRYIKETINSVLSQTGYFEIEYIIADGGSNDETISIIKDFESKLSSGKIVPKCTKLKLIYWSKKDKGQTDAINQGFAKATGQYFGWLNSDDFFTKNDSLNQMVNVLIERPDVSIVQGDLTLVYERSKVIGKSEINNLDNKEFHNRLRHIESTCFIQQPSTLFTQEFWEELKGLDNSLYYTMDWDMWIRAYKLGKKFFKIDYPIASFRMHSGSKTTNPDLNYAREHLRLYKKHHIWNSARWSCIFSIAIISIKLFFSRR